MKTFTFNEHDVLMYGGGALIIFGVILLFIIAHYNRRSARLIKQNSDNSWLEGYRAGSAPIGNPPPGWSTIRPAAQEDWSARNSAANFSARPSQPAPPHVPPQSTQQTRSGFSAGQVLAGAAIGMGAGAIGAAMYENATRKDDDDETKRMVPRYDSSSSDSSWNTPDTGSSYSDSSYSDSSSSDSSGGGD